MRVGLDGDILRQTYFSDYSGSFTSPHGGSDITSDAVFYAIRFKTRTNDCPPMAYEWDYDAATATGKSYTYPPSATDNLKCAYRFRRVQGLDAWSSKPLTSRLIIDVVYLGEESTPTELSTISNEFWWSRKKSQSLVISRTFPISGRVEGSSNHGVSGFWFNRGLWGSYWSSNQKAVFYAWNVDVNPYWVDSRSSWSNLDTGFPVRLFTRKNH